MGDFSLSVRSWGKKALLLALLFVGVVVYHQRNNPFALYEAIKPGMSYDDVKWRLGNETPSTENRKGGHCWKSGRYLIVVWFTWEGHGKDAPYLVYYKDLW